MLERAYNALIAAGLDARLAAQYSGACAAPYCVVYEGQNDPPGKSIAVCHVLVDVLVPVAKPGLLPVEMRKVRAAMAAADFHCGSAGATIVLEDYKAVSATIDFAALCSRAEV